MAIREIVPLGHPALKAKNSVIKSFTSEKTKRLIRDLRDTMRKNDLVGIAAPQIGENFQVFLTEPRKTKSRTSAATDKLRVFINPKIVRQSKTNAMIWEGCGCTESIFAPLKRAKEVTIEAFDTKGKIFQITANGLLGRIFLHEMDHLSGIEFVQRVTDNKTFVHKNWYVKNIRNSKQNVRNSIITKLEVID